MADSVEQVKCDNEDTNVVEILNEPHLILIVEFPSIMGVFAEEAGEPFRKVGGKRAEAVDLLQNRVGGLIVL